VGAWKLLKKWTPEQLRELLSLYQSHWGPMNNWTDEQLEWVVEVGRGMAGDSSSAPLPEQVPCDVELVTG
jgi:hypothetical protein